MDPRYEAYTIADSTWYEPLDRCQDSDSRFSLAVRELPEGWRREHQGVWEFLTPGDAAKLPEQGWKIHVSATPGAAEETIEAAWNVCRRLGLPWKFLRSRQIVAAMNTKYAHRAASGKAVTVYPRTTEELRTALEELETAMRGRPGPYVLSDRRWNDGPVSVRYGAFALMWCELADGTRVPAMRTPQGKLVPDPRRPVFTVPPWAGVPDFLAEQPAAEGASASLGGYEVRKALHFSNGGGVYLAADGCGGQVVLKEARPHAPSTTCAQPHAPSSTRARRTRDSSPAWPPATAAWCWPQPCSAPPASSRPSPAPRPSPIWPATPQAAAWAVCGTTSTGIPPTRPRSQRSWRTRPTTTYGPASPTRPRS
nr:hypothetical protein [Streptomyces rectiverticillatus]